MFNIIAIEVENNLNSQRMGVMKILRQVYGEDVESKIEKTPSGKPFLNGVDSVYKHFNVSHSGNYAICVFSSVPIGVDIEKIRPINQRVIDRFLDSCHPDEAIRIWTRRESFGKMTGGGFHDKSYGDVPHQFYEYNDIEGYLITVCVSRTGGFVVTDSDFPKDITWYQE